MVSLLKMDTLLKIMVTLLKIMITQLIMIVDLMIMIVVLNKDLFALQVCDTVVILWSIHIIQKTAFLKLKKMALYFPFALN